MYEEKNWVWCSGNNMLIVPLFSSCWSCRASCSLSSSLYWLSLMSAGLLVILAASLSCCSVVPYWEMTSFFHANIIVLMCMDVCFRFRDRHIGHALNAGFLRQSLQTMWPHLVRSSW